MADIQIAVIDQQNTQISVIDQQNTQLALSAPDETQVNIAVPGVQGPKGDIGTIAGAQDGTNLLPGIAFANDLDTGIYRVGANSIGISTGGTGRLFVDASGRLLVGTNQSLADLVGGSGVNLQLTGSTYQTSSVQQSAFANNQLLSPILILNKGRGSVASPADVLQNDRLGTILFTGYSAGTANQIAGSIECFVDGEPGTGGDTSDVPGRLTFGTSPDGSGNVTERARIRADGMFEVKGAGVAGSSPAFSVSGSAPANSFVLGSTGRVGIGTQTPGAILDVNGSADTVLLSNTTNNASTKEAKIQLRHYTSSEENLSLIYGYSTTTVNGVVIGGGPSGNNAATEISFRTAANQTTTAGTERARIDASGRVGIGTTAPGYLLDVRRASAGDVVAFTGSTDGGRALKFVSADNGIFLGAQWTRDIVSGSGIHAWAINGAERARLDSSGRLLVGTISDSGGALLQVNGNRIRVATAKTPASATDTGTAGEICWDANYIYVCTATNTWKRTAIATW